ncbi:hypothetical protein [Lysobacter sp. CA199]|uniref:hypothetical protein n=1 Tax=Lysobacter sp. CA199 TaxID=3455608 RepID=UPI003F8D0914
MRKILFAMLLCLAALPTHATVILATFSGGGYDITIWGHSSVQEVEMDGPGPRRFKIPAPPQLTVSGSSLKREILIKVANPGDPAYAPSFVFKGYGTRGTLTIGGKTFTGPLHWDSGGIGDNEDLLRFNRFYFESPGHPHGDMVIALQGYEDPGEPVMVYNDYGPLPLPEGSYKIQMNRKTKRLTMRFINPSVPAIHELERLPSSFVLTVDGQAGTVKHDGKTYAGTAKWDFLSPQRANSGRQKPVSRQDHSARP